MKTKKIQPKNDEYVIYTRRSTDDADNQKNSLAYQESEGLRFAKSLGLKVTKETIEGYCKNGLIAERHSAYKTSSISIGEDGKVGYVIERPKFQQMVQDLASGKYKGVIALCWDRLSRNDQDAIIIKHLSDGLGVDVRFIQATYEQSASGALHRDIDGMFSKHYSREVSQKTRNALEKLRAEGVCTYVSPIGYLDEGSSNKVFDPERAPFIKRIFELYATGEWSYRQLAAWATQNGLTTKPMRTRRTREQKLADQENLSEKIPHCITAKSIENILSNPFYIGKLKHRGIAIDGIHSVLIDPKLFYEVQAMLVKRNKSVHYPDKDFQLYRGILRCPCGRSYSPYEQKGLMYYRPRCIEGCDNLSPNTSEDKVTNHVLEALLQIAIGDKERADIDSKKDVGLNLASTMREKQRQDAERAYNRLRDDLSYLKSERITLMRTGAMDPATYASEVQRLEGELQEVEKKLVTTKETAEEMLNTILEFSELVKMASITYKYANPRERHNLLTQAFTELRLANDNFTYDPKEGFLKLFQRHDKKKTHHDEHDVVSGSGGGDRTRDLRINSPTLCR